MSPPPDLLQLEPELAHYRDALDAYLDGTDVSDELLVHTGAALSTLARHRKLRPEQLLIAIRPCCLQSAVLSGSPGYARRSQERSSRMTHAIGRLLESYFSPQP